RLYDRIVRRQRLELVGRRTEPVASHVTQPVREDPVEPPRTVDSRADGGAALRDQQQPRERGAYAGDSVLRLLHIAGELLTEGKRRRILQMRAADLDDARERPLLRRQRAAQLIEGGQQH